MGTAKVTHCAQCHLGAGGLFVSLDIDNAFISIYRKDLLGCLPRDLPGLGFIERVYQVATPVYHRSGVSAEMDRGVIQGCPLSAALFNYALTVLVITPTRGACAVPAPCVPPEQGVVPEVQMHGTQMTDRWQGWTQDGSHSTSTRCMLSSGVWVSRCRQRNRRPCCPGRARNSPCNGHPSHFRGRLGG